MGNKVVKLVYCRTEKMIADILSKGLPKPKFEERPLMLGVTVHLLVLCSIVYLF